MKKSEPPKQPVKNPLNRVTKEEDMEMDTRIAYQDPPKGWEP